MVTFVRRSYTSGPFTGDDSEVKLALGDGMPSGVDTKQRRGNRTKAVIPVRVKGKDSSGKAFDELVHTLDVTPEGARLGSVRRELNLLDEVTVFYRQRRIQFRVVWTKKMKGTSEFQVGLQAVTGEGEAWGLNSPEFKREPVLPVAVAQVTEVAYEKRTSL
jgi:hypothetical protein